MPLGDFSIICFRFLSDFWRKSQKRAKRKTGQNGPLCCNEGHPCRGVSLRRSEGCLATVRPKGQKGHPSATLQRRHCSQRQNFRIFFSKVSYSYTDNLRTLIND